MSTIKENLQRVLNTLPQGKVTLVAVSKTHPPEKVREAYDAGHRDFGENKVQELLSKVEHLPDDIHWHLIGHLQRNKVKYISPFVHLIHSVDSERLLAEIDKEARKNNRIISCLLQIHIALEETKFGLDRGEAEEVLSNMSRYPNARICGLMGMATNTDDEEQVRQEFRGLKGLFDELQAKYFADNAEQFSMLSMGMSGDYPIAVEERSTMVRVGSLIFGEREYQM